MAKVTSKLQVTIPKAIADSFGIVPGVEVDWIAAGDAIRVVTTTRESPEAELRRRLALFDEATARQASRQRSAPPRKPAKARGWTREDLYRRDRTG